METTYERSYIEKEFKTACKTIRQANKGLPFPVKIDHDYKLFIHPNYMTLQVNYLDGDCKYQVHNIAL